MKQKPTVFIICPVHNDLDHTKALLKSIKKQSYQSVATIIVDDGSTDGTGDYITKWHPEIILLKGDGSLWWTGATHWGIKEAFKQAKKGDFILTINNDCVFDKNYVSTLVQVSKNNQRAILGSLVLHKKDPKQIWDGGVKLDWSKPMAQFYGLGPSNIKDLPKNKSFVEVDTVSGKGALIPIEVFKRVGNYAVRRLPHYLADYEFGVRAKKEGFRIILSYQARVYNDTFRTGKAGISKDHFSYQELASLLFSRRSKVNIVDHWNIISLACPPKHRFRNRLFLLAKISHYILHVWPFYFIPIVLKRLKNILGIKNLTFSKLFAK